jgi:hypothetical protein
MMKRAAVLAAVWLSACGGGGAGGDDDDGPPDAFPEVCVGVDCSGHGTCVAVDGAALCQCDGGYVRSDATTCVESVGPSLGGCPLLPANHLFNTPIDALPVHPDSDAFIATIGPDTEIHLDLGTTVDQQDPEYYGIPYNLVHGDALDWPEVAFEGDLGWDPRPESDCAVGEARTFAQPCTADVAPAPLLPIPDDVLVEGGINTSPDQQPYGDHHILLLDVDACWLWETYHSYQDAGGQWDIFGAAAWDLTSNALRPDGWTSADAAGFPILPLLIRADEASAGEIRHALRFTIETDKIRTSYVWPARHLTNNGTDSTDLPPMGQLFRLKASYEIPAGAHAQTRAILQAMKTYGMYIADGGSDMYVQGEPSAAWADEIFDEVQAVPASAFEAVDLSPIMARDGWDADSGAVP